MSDDSTFIGTTEQLEAREERIAICIHDGGLTEAEAIALCDSRHWLYGHSGKQETQGDLL